MGQESWTIPRSAWIAVAVAALGYFVDIYDLILFTVVRDPSLTAIGVPAADQRVVGNLLMNAQMAGMLAGGILWGVLGDKRGRLSVLFGSILTYSVANIANGFVEDVTTYAVLRLIAGIGLAGELGAGITLVSEVLPPRSRGYATSAVAGIGICGAVLAVVVGKNFAWQEAYWIGGGMGLFLLVLRVGVLESKMFAKAKDAAVLRGSFFALFSNRRRAIRYLAVVGVGVPIWYAVGILVANSTEIGRALGLEATADRAIAVLLAYVGLAIGDFGSGVVSQLAQSRRRALAIFLSMTVLSIALYFVGGRVSASWMYAAIFLLGIATGYWAVFVTVGAEQFGTNLRATAATTAPNFVRGSLVPVTLAFEALAATAVGLVGSAIVVGVVVMALAFASLAQLDETFGKDLDYVER